MDFVAGELEGDIWQRVASGMVGTQRGAARGSAGRDGVVRTFIADLRRSVDGREVIKNLHCGSALILTVQFLLQFTMLSFHFDTSMSDPCY